MAYFGLGSLVFGLEVKFDEWIQVRWTRVAQLNVVDGFEFLEIVLRAGEKCENLCLCLGHC